MPTLSSIAIPSNSFPIASVDSNTISTTATKSSTTSTPSTTPANFCSRSPRSSNDLKTTAVDDIDSIPPRKMLVMCENPIRFPAVYPRNIIPDTITTAATTAVLPTLISLRKENSRPIANSRNITPMSAHILMFAVSATVGRNGTAGPARIPATIYPSTTGCFSHLNNTVTTPAAIKITAKSEIKGATSDISSNFIRYTYKFNAATTTPPTTPADPAPTAPPPA